MSSPKFRPLRFGVTRVTLKDGVPGTHYLKADQELQAFPEIEEKKPIKALAQAVYV